MDALKSNKNLILKSSFFLIVVVSLLMFLSALWLHRTLYTPENLSNITTEALSVQSSRDSIASAVTNRIFEDNPVLLATAGPRLTTVISGLLGSDIASNSISTVVERLRLAMTTDSDSSIVIQLTPIKETILNVQNVIGQSAEERRINTENIPDEVVLLDTTNLPNYYSLGIIVLWLGPISFLVAFGGLTYWIYKGRAKALYKRIRISGVLMLVATFIALMFGPLFEPIFVSFSKQAQGQTLLGNLYDGLIAPFNQQALVLGIIGVALITSSYLLPLLARKSSSSKQK